jgi:hypothetical protein
MKPGVRTLEAIEKDDSFQFLTQKLFIPRQTLFHVLAHYCLGGARNMHDCLELLMQAQQWNEAHQCLFASPWIYSSILGEDYSRPLDILRTLKSFSHGISEWNTRGQVI